MFSQDQRIQRAMNPQAPAITESANLQVTVDTLRVDLDSCFASLNTQQRANAVLVLWGADKTEDTRSFGEQIKQLISLQAGDDPHHSARFALALDFTLDHIDDIGMEEAQRHQLNDALNVIGRDYDSTATEVRAIIEKSLKARESSALGEDPSEFSFIPPVPFQGSSGQQSTDFQSARTTETPKKRADAGLDSRTKRAQRTERHRESAVALDTKPLDVNSDGRAGSRRSVKAGLSSLALGVHAAFSAAGDKLFAAGKKLIPPIREATEWIRHNASVWSSKGSAVVRKAITSVRARLSPTLTDVGIPTGDRLRNALNGKAVARLKSSAGQIAETAGDVAKASATRVAKGVNKATDAIRKAGAASGHAMASAGRVVAHGVAHGAKAIGAFVSKGAAWIGNRWSGLRGFERV